MSEDAAFTEPNQELPASADHQLYENLYEKYDNKEQFFGPELAEIFEEFDDPETIAQNTAAAILGGIHEALPDNSPK